MQVSWFVSRRRNDILPASGCGTALNERRILVHDLDCPGCAAAHGAPRIGREDVARDRGGAERMVDLSRFRPASRAEAAKGQRGTAMANAAVRFQTASQCSGNRGANRRVAYDSDLDPG